MLERVILICAAMLFGSCAKSATGPTRPPVAGEYESIDFREGVTPIATIYTEFGNIEIELLPDSAPANCKQFTYLSDLHFYDHTTIHRVVPTFVIQGGDPTGNGYGTAGYYIPLEPSSMMFEEGTVGMARTADPNTASSQFFICLSRQSILDGKYTIIGQVVAGLDVVHEIEKVSTQADKPVEPVAVRRIRVSR